MTEDDLRTAVSDELRYRREAGGSDALFDAAGVCAVLAVVVILAAVVWSIVRAIGS